MTRHKDIVNGQYLQMDPSYSAWAMGWLPWSGSRWVDRQYGCVTNDHHAVQAGFRRLILILCHAYMEASGRHGVPKLWTI